MGAQGQQPAVGGVPRNDGGEFGQFLSVGQLGRNPSSRPAIAACATFDDATLLAIHFIPITTQSFIYETL
jgi:hypothetical protein